MGDSMSTIINATTTNGVVIQPDNSGSLVLQTNNGTTALTVDTSQNTTLAGKLTTASSGIQFSDASTQTAAASPYVLKNRIINGDMRIDQRNAGASVTASVGSSVTYTLDRWAYNQNITSKYTIQQNAGSVTPPVGFANYLGVTSTSAYSVASGDFIQIEQRIEGFNFADLAWGTANAKTITLSFWVRSSLTGTFGAWLGNSDGNRIYPISYSISSANTWEQKTVTIAGDTTGTWVGSTNGTGLRLVFVIGYGTTYQGTVTNTWNAATFYAPTGATSVVGTNGATLYITGVQLEQNTSATPFERRLYNQELANCQRYYWEMARGSLSSNATNSWMGEGGFYSTSQYNLPVMFPVTMRTSPTLNVSNTSAYFGLDTPTGQTFATFAIFQPSIYGTLIYATGLSGGTAGYACSAFTRNAAAFCAFSAEL
jgi:hypothetical protein